MNFKRKEFIDFLILLFGALILYYLLVTNKVILFLNPRMNKYILFTFIVFIALCINQFLNAFSIDSLKWIKGGVIAFFGILILFTYPIYKVHMDNKRVQKEINAEKKYEKIKDFPNLANTILHKAYVLYYEKDFLIDENNCHFTKNGI